MPSGLFTRRQHLQAVITNSWAGRPSSVDYLVVAGGGGGGDNPDTSNGNGGGGAGGLLQGTVAAPTTATTVTVGSGSGRFDAAGGDSVFGSITSKGGGSGARHNYFSGLPGGSGGGGSSGASYLSGGQGIFGQGNAGGTGITTNSGGGGGGAGSVGLNGITNIGGSGGAGIASDISGSRVLYAGGGGGGVLSGGTSGAGGIGGGGTGNGTAGVPNTGSGGGSAPNYGNAGTGGSGIVIISYPGTTQWYSGGTLSFAENRVVHTFYSSGTLTPIQPVEFADTTYQISRSLRFNSADSAYLDRTPASASNRKTWTWSAWVKLSAISTGWALFSAGTGSQERTYLYYLNVLQFRTVSASAGVAYVIESTAVYRDPSAWYHIVISWDTTSATSSDRMKLWVNGAQVTALGTATYPTQNFDAYVNANTLHTMGKFSNGNFDYGNGYMTEVNFIDGLALTPQAFGFTNPNTGVWSPLRYTGSYGTNGFYLNFSDNSNNTAATLGKDSSGNGLNWTPNNFSITAGAGNDSLVDSPTNYGTDTGVGGEVRGNYATWNAVLQTLGGTASTYTNGNLVASSTSSNWVLGTIRINDAKYYFELVPDSAASSLYLGLNSTTDVRITAYSGGIEASPGGGSNQGSLASWSNGDVIGVAVDGPNKTVQFYRNGSTYGTLVTYTTTLDLWAFARNGGLGSSQVTANFGQRPFAYTAPSGYKALCTQNLPTPTIGATSTTRAGKYFNPVLYSGAGTQAITGVGFQPDMVWLKSRSNADGWAQCDAVRGADKLLQSNNTNAESTTASVSAFSSDGFTVDNNWSTSGRTYVSYSWKANGAGSSNTAGSITSTVSANTTAGFSIVKYTGSASAGATVGHGLGVAPRMILFKLYSTTSNWIVYHASVGATKILSLNGTGAEATSAAFNNTAPTSSVFTLGGSGEGTNDASMIAYCFAPVAGYSAFGSFVGNGSDDGPFNYLGFRPAFILVKRSSSSGEGWWIYDNKRDAFNITDNILEVNSSGAEISGGTYPIDMTSNGFKIRGINALVNTSGATYIYAAFAEAPFKYSRAR